MPIDIAWLRAEKGGDPAKVRESEIRRGRDGKIVDEVVAADGVWRENVFEMEMIKKELNAVNKSIGVRKKKDRTDACTDQVENAAKLKERIPLAEEAANAASTKRDVLLKKIGNIVQTSVVTSTDEENNAVLRTWKPESPAPQKAKESDAGAPTSQPTSPKSHHELMVSLDMVDLKRGAELAGHRGYFLKGAGVTLNWALVQFGMSFLRKQGYTPVQPPYFMRKEIMAETAELADFDESLYRIPMGKLPTDEGKAAVDDASNYDLFMIATSEQPISALHRNEYVEPKALPIRYAGISTCFRKEAGAHGKDMAGIFRVHQFEKVEQFVLTTPEESEAMHEEMIALAEEFYKALKLPYRVVSIVSGALNDAASKKYDLEAWFPSYNAYRELVSCSNCLDYQVRTRVSSQMSPLVTQARALNVRLGHPKMGDREKKFVHMLNSTLVASERTMCCILENYQREDGIEVPEVLAPFMDNQTLIPFAERVGDRK